MPVLSRFYGIVIRMYFLQSEHNPPHIHAIYNDDVAAIDFMTGDVLEGHLPPKELTMVREWLSIHKDSLQDARVSEAPSVGIRRCMYVPQGQKCFSHFRLQTECPVQRRRHQGV